MESYGQQQQMRNPLHASADVSSKIANSGILQVGQLLVPMSVETLTVICLYQTASSMGVMQVSTLPITQSFTG
jgi:3-polyprenyl-4-hydroxybenzoate decarboxylase